MSISVVFVGKNLILNGYPFVESLLSVLPLADEFIISEGYSDDDSLNYLWKFKKKYETRERPIFVYQDEWPDRSYHGEAITYVLERAIQKASKKWVLYLQADEIWHEDMIPYMLDIVSKDNFEFNSISFPYFHFINSWEPSKDTKYYQEAMRFVRNDRGIKLLGDAWNFITPGPADPIYAAGYSPNRIFHMNWCLPENNDIKHIEHAKLYENITEYQDIMKNSLNNLKEEKKPYPISDDFPIERFPELAKRFVGKVKYELPEI